MKQLKEKIKKAFAEYKLIGYCYFNEDEYSELIKYAYLKCNELIQNQNRHNFEYTDYQIIFITLVQIANRWKSHSRNDGSFWRYVCRIIFGNDNNDSKLYPAFIDVINRLGKYQKLAIAESGQRYYTTIMMHSFSPQNSIYSFFDLCYNIYKKDLEYCFTTNDQWLCEVVLKQLRNVLGGNYSDDKSVSIGSSAYSIKIGLRAFVLNENLSVEFIEFIANIFNSINKLFTRERIDKKTRLDYYIIEWWRDKIEIEKPDERPVINIRTPTVSKQNISVKYLNTDKGVLLSIPSIRLDYATDIMGLSIFVENKNVYCEEMRTKRGEFVVATKAMEFELNQLLQDTNAINIRVVIKENESIIFDSEKRKAISLWREFILFNGEKEVFSQINKPTNYFVFSKDIDSLKECPEDLNGCGANLYNIYPAAGEYIIGETKQVYFVNNNKCSNLGRDICIIGNIENIEWLLNDRHYSVYKNVIKLMIPENWDLKPLELRINENVYKLKQLNCEGVEFGCYQYDLKANNLIPEDSPICIALYSYEKEKILGEERMIFFSNLGIHFNSSLYYGDVERKVNVEYHNKIIEQTWAKGECEIICSINKGTLIIKIPYLRWRINNTDWHSDPITKKLWYKEFIENGDLLEVECFNEDETFSISVSFDGNMYEIPKNRRGKFELGRVIYSNENKTDINVHFTNGRAHFLLFNIATKEHFIESPFISNNGFVSLNFKYNFIGNKKTIFFVTIKNEYKNVEREIIGVENIEIGKFRDDLYDVTVKVIDDNVFSKVDNYINLFDGKLVIGKPEKFRFKNKYIRIESVFIRKGWEKLNQQYVIRDLEYIEQHDAQENSNEYYQGRLKIAGVNSSFLDFLKNEKGKNEKINPVRIELRDCESFWLECDYDYNENMCNIGGLVYDTRKRELCNINLNHKDQNTIRFIPIDLCKFKEEEYV